MHSYVTKLEKLNAANAQPKLDKLNGADVAQLLVCFWKSALDVVRFHGTTHVTVTPLAHANPSLKGFSVFQLLVEFPGEGTRDLVEKTVKRLRDLDSSDLDSKKDRAAAWKRMLELMLVAATDVGKSGPYYTLTW